MTEPGYWMYEETGVLREPVRKYLEGAPLTEADVAALRAYGRQWVGAEHWEANPYGGQEMWTRLRELREGVEGIRTREDLERWTERAIEAGMDPW